MEHPIIAGFVFLNFFMIVGAVDLFYFHIWKYKLHARPESRFEHNLHMTSAILMVPVAYFLYFQNFGGYALWVAVFFIVAGFATEILDVLFEGDSRASLGGLTTGEFSLHVTATILKITSFALMFAVKPIGAWSLNSPIVLDTHGPMAELIALIVMIGSFLVAILHLVLLSPKVVSFNCQTICDFTGCSRFTCCKN
ncbi:MAG: hypothetical protein WBD27_16860 [Pyrinomonadaceae bacterium]